MLRLLKKSFIFLSVVVLVFLVFIAVTLQTELTTLSEEHSNLEKKISELIKEYEWLNLKNWIKNASNGDFPQELSNLNFAEMSIHIFYFYTAQIEDIQDNIALWSISENVNPKFLCLNQSENFVIFEQFCNATQFQTSETQESYVVFVAHKQIIIWKTRELNQQTFEKCIRYLTLSMEMETKLAN